MNGNLFKIVLISVVAILLAIIGGVMSADGDPFSIALAVSPFLLAVLFLMKEKVWYLWIWLPLLFLPIPELKDYAPLFAYGITIPFYLWNAMLKRSTLTWNAAPLLDAVILVLFMHVGYVFLSHPFGLGLNVLEDYYGGKGYVLFLQALLAYLCLSSLKTTSNELGKVLQWAVFLTIIFTLISTAQGILSPNSAGANPAAAAVSASAASEDTRQSTFLQISLLAVQLLIINYSVWQMIKRPWWAPFLSLEPSESCLADSAPLLRSFCSCFHNISDLQKMVLLHPGSHLRNAFASAPLLLRNAPFLSLRYPAHTFSPSFPGCQHASQSKRGSVHELAL